MVTERIPILSGPLEGTNLTIIGRAEDHIDKKTRKTYARSLCKCLECNKEYLILNRRLHSGKYKTKGCRSCYGAKHIEIGTIIGNWIIIARASSRGRKNVSCSLCKCNLCNTEHVIPNSRLRSGNSTKCRPCSVKSISEVVRAKSGYDGQMSSWRARFCSLKHGAIDRGYEFKITLEDFKNIASKPCSYCDSLNVFSIYLQKDGLPRTWSSTNTNIKNITIENSKIMISGIDRADNALGYTLENSVPCCSLCNYLKREMSISELISRIEKILTNKQALLKLEKDRASLNLTKQPGAIL